MTNHRSRTLTALAAASATLSLMVAAPAAAAPSAPSAQIAPCTPTELPMFPGGTAGEVMWMTHSGLYVGGSEDGVVYGDGSREFKAAYWTHDAAGYHIHALPNDPLVNDEVLDENQSERMVVYGLDPATGTYETYVFDLPSNTWWHLPGLGGPSTRARRINASGVVAGGGRSSRGRFALTWASPYTTATRLASNGRFAYAAGINDAGTAVGLTIRGEWTPADDKTMQHLGPHAYFPLGEPMEWFANGSAVHLPVIFSQAEAFAINNAGTIVGGADVDLTNRWDAVYWRDGAIYDMGGAPDASTEARGLSQGGWATGDSETETTGHAFVWTGSGTLEYLPALDGPDGNSNAHGVDDVLHQVGGWSDDGSGNGPPTVWQCPVGFTTG